MYAHRSLRNRRTKKEKRVFKGSAENRASVAEWLIKKDNIDMYLVGTER
jgi:hypothetical protein